MEDKLLSIGEVSKYLKIPKSTIYKLSRKGEIPSSKIGKQLRFRKSTVDIWLDSQENKYDTSRTRLPAHQSKNILLIDDDKLVLRTITRFLKQQGCSVDTASSGEEAIKKAEKLNFDLIIVDVRMPGLNGIETIKRIRTSYTKSNRQSAPEIVITGYLDPKAQREAEKIGITDYIYKPFAISDFIKSVKKKLGGS